MFKLFHFGTLLLQLVVGVSSRKLAECFENLTWNSCESIRSCMWVRGGCLTRNVWLGYAELGQTHVIRARGETRLAPKIIAEREAELLFFPTTESDPTPAPTGAPSSPIEQEYGLEKIGYLTAELPSSSLRWPNGYPKDVSKLIDGTDSEYYFPGSVPDVDIKFDLLQNRAINGVYIKIWYYTNIDSIKIGLQSDEGVTTWIDGGSHTDGLNEEVSITFRAKAARYLRIRLTGGSLFDDKSSEWGLRTVKISGNLDANIVEDPVDNEDDNDSPLSSFFPPETADVIVEAYTASGIILGEIKARPTSQQRGIMDQAGTDEPLEPYSKTKEMWSATLPWHWVKEGTQLVISVANSDGIVISYDLQLVNTVLWSEHTLIRQKFVLFGTDQQFKRLNTFTYDASRLATGMFGIMPIATLNWVDATVLHWPYLIISTSKGPRIVYNEKERRAEMLKAGDDPSTEPGWEFTKYMVAFRTSFANTGRGFVITTMEAPGEHGSPYSTQTAIAMGWALVNDNSSCTFCEYKSLGYWDGWSAAAWSGWCGMRAGDECGNTLSHEIGHSMTLSHFTEGTALDWGIADEYPEDGTHLASHPWGYDTPSRQFRTWFNVHDGSSKRDPMNGGGDYVVGSCFEHYTGFHGQRSQQWGYETTQVLNSDTSNVPSDGLYLYDTENDLLSRTNPESRFSVPIETGVPVLTIIGTIGNDVKTCQIYPPSSMSYGHTFQFPSPFGKDLDSAFNGASYMVEVSFSDGSNEKGLIASPDLSTSKELRLFSFNVAISRKPVVVKLYRFKTKNYPNLSPSSGKALLYSRDVSLQVAQSASIAQNLKVGRGWLGQSGDVSISKFCFSEAECRKIQIEVMWRGVEGSDLSFSALVSSSSGEKVSSLTFPATLLEDGKNYMITVRAVRFVGDSGWMPLLGGIPQSTSLQPDTSYGIAIWLPFDANTNLPFGTYDALVPVATGKIQGTAFVNIRIKLNLVIPRITDTAYLYSSSFTSGSFKTPSSSIYFLTDDATIGPTERVWWGDSRETLAVPLYAANCNNAEVIASIKAQNKCGNSLFQMNAGRGKNDCTEQRLYLELDDSNANPWLLNSTLASCRFETPRVRPVGINSYRWHDPNAEQLLGSMKIAIVVESTTTSNVANLHLGPYISENFVDSSSTFYFLAQDRKVGPVRPVSAGQSFTNLTLSLKAFNCQGKEVKAKFRAQNKCDEKATAMNARNGMTNCQKQNFYLELHNSAINTWLKNAAYKPCVFQTSPGMPLIIDAYRWQKPFANGKLNTLSIEVNVDVSKMTV